MTTLTIPFERNVNAREEGQSRFRSSETIRVTWSPENAYSRHLDTKLKLEETARSYARGTNVVLIGGCGRDDGHGKAHEAIQLLSG